MVVCACFKKKSGHSSLFPPNLKPEERADKLLAQIKIRVHPTKKINDFWVIGNEAGNEVGQPLNTHDALELVTEAHLGT